MLFLLVSYGYCFFIIFTVFITAIVIIDIRISTIFIFGIITIILIANICLTVAEFLCGWRMLLEEVTSRLTTSRGRALRIPLAPGLQGLGFRLLCIKMGRTVRTSNTTNNCNSSSNSNNSSA